MASKVFRQIEHPTDPWWFRYLLALCPSETGEDGGYRVTLKRWRGKLYVWKMEVPNDD